MSAGDSGPAIFTLSTRGAALGQRLAPLLGARLFAPERLRASLPPAAQFFGPSGLKPAMSAAYRAGSSLVLIMPVGAAVRLLAPLLVHKSADPPVVALDEFGQHAVPLASSHAGGANDLARRIAAFSGARPVITTAADLAGAPSLELLAKTYGWTIERWGGLARFTAAVLEGEPVGVFQNAGEEAWWEDAPDNLTRYPSIESLLAGPLSVRAAITDLRLPESFLSELDVLLRPRSLVVGVGCVRGATATEIEALLGRALAENGLSDQSVGRLATIDVKRDEPGLLELAERHGWELSFFSPEDLRRVRGPSGPSGAVERAVGAGAVCEPAALLASGATELLVPKVKTGRVTVAVARAAAPSGRGDVTVVGLGPGSPGEMTLRARQALIAADAVVGYQGYVDQVRPWLGRKLYHTSPIGREVERCRLALDLARSGLRVALVSSGDAGIYGMAGPLLELTADAGPPVPIEVVPGVSAAQAAAALLGAPLMSDFAAISLSNLLTPWPVIRRRLEAAAAADLVVVLYNPASGRRKAPFAGAVEALLAHRPASTPAGIVRNAGRPDQSACLTDLGSLAGQPVDMFCTVIVGNSQTVRLGDRVVTRRGYQHER